ncbi:hypothetical protein SCHPADRAFT_993079 [Schizopora paradoxa]|uniref:Zn(2)-C6 fungal-type domain-containing protein n=1 Tax=Schizopora paradoxa TaxID=27342 RepID=A0A0H2S4J7_9AGAM|nr:hypothetical protein SCHPADRAFT_993079 [Schizopora paradoxa]
MSSAPHRIQQDTSAELDPKIINAASFKGPKRKRLLKACDACHKSKRRCDGTAPCSNCYFASKECTYTDGSGRAVPAPNAPRPELVASSSTSVGPSAGLNVFPHQLQSPDTMLSGPLTTAPLRYPNLIATAGAHASTFHVQTTPGGSQQDVGARPHPRKRAREQQDAEGASQNYKVDSTEQSYAHAQSRSHEVPQTTLSHWSLSSAGGSMSSQPDFDRSVMRELVNLFFAHCHPHRLIIHSPTFLNDLYLDRVPGYLLNAVCALAAPLSRNPRVRRLPVRQAGLQFAKAAHDAMFDDHEKLKVPIHLQTAQALALLQSYLIYESGRMEGEFQYFNLAFSILDNLNIHSPAPPPSSGNESISSFPIDPNHPILTPMPSPELWINAVQRECARRTFWFMHLVELLGFMFVRRRPTHSPRALRRNMTALDTHKFAGTQATKGESPLQNSQTDGLRIRLPCSEAEFEVSVYSALPEYLNSPAPRSRNASEFGHLIRITTILVEIEECNVEEVDAASIGECEERLKAWATSLSEHLQYSDVNLEFQLSLWETSSNTTTWCFCFMHVLHACCILALNDISRRLGHEQSHEYGSALDAVLKIMTGIGPRARNSIIMGSVLWLQHCGPHARPNGANGSPEGGTIHAHRTLSKPPNVPELQSNIEGWLKEWEEIWGPLPEGHMQTIPAQEKQDEQQSVSMGLSDRQWAVPEVVIDPLLRNESESEQRNSAAKGGSQALSLTSLPSLKASGLLDVVPPPEDTGSSAGRTSPWSATASSVSPRMPLRSPALLQHPHLTPNPSASPSSPLPSTSSSRSLDPSSISSQDRSRGAIDPYAPSGAPQMHFVGDEGSSDRGSDYLPNNRQWSDARTQQPSLRTPPILVPSHNDLRTQSPRRKRPGSS